MAYPIASATSLAASNTLTLTAGTLQSGSGATGTSAGDGIVVGASINNATGILPTGVTDSAGNVYVAGPSATAQYGIRIFTAVSGPGGGTTPTVALPSGTGTITVTYATSSAIGKTACAAGTPGVVPGAPADISLAGGSAGSPSPSLTSGALAQASEGLVALVATGAGAGAITWTGTFSQVVPGFMAASNQWSGMGAMTSATTAPVTAQGTITSAKWSMLLVSLRLLSPSPFAQPGRAARGASGARLARAKGSPGAPVVVPAPFAQPRRPARGASGARAGRAKGSRGSPVTPPPTVPAPFAPSRKAAKGASGARPGHAKGSAGAPVVIPPTTPAPFAQPRKAARGASGARPGRARGSAGAPVTALAPGFPSVPGIARPGGSTPGYPSAAPAPPPPPPPVPGVVQQIAGQSYGEYGLHAIEITARPGNGLVVFAGWDTNYSASPAAVPACYVSDSAGNKWYHLGTSDPDNSGARCCMWMAPNIMPVGGSGQPPGWVSVSLTGFAASLAYLVIEMDNLPPLCVPDVSVTSSDPGTSAMSVTAAGTASLPGIGFSLAVAGSGAPTLISPPAGWDALMPVESGQPETDSVQIWPFLMTSVTQGNVTAAYGTNAGAPLAAALATIQASPAQPVFPSANVPGLYVGMALGFLPGDVSASPPALQDVTQRCIGKDGDAWLEYSYGHEYPLDGAEAGTLTVGVRNSDGAFTPGSVTSPYWSNAITPNPGFETAVTGADGLAVSTGDLTGWTALGNAALDVQQSYVYSGSWSAILTPDGVTANPGLAVAMMPVSSRDYCASIWAYLTGSDSVIAAIGWYSLAGTLLSTSLSSPFTPAPGAWSQVSVRQAAYPGSAYGLAWFYLSGVTADVSYWDTGGLCPGGQTVQTGCVDDLVLIHADAFWDGRWYDLAHGYVQNAPVEFPDLPQYGLSRMKAADSIAIMASCTLPSAVQGEILIDRPYVYLPCAEQYLTVTTGLTGAASTTLDSVGFAQAQFLAAANMSLSNQRSGMYANGGGTDAETGLALNLLGDQGTGMGASSYSGTQGTGAGAGVIYSDPSMPSPADGTGVALECWFVQSDGNSPTLLTAYQQPSMTGPLPDLLGAALTAIPDGSTGELVIFFPGGPALVMPYAQSQDPQQLVILVTPDASTVYGWLNGALGGSVSLPPDSAGSWSALTLGGARYSFGPVPALGNYALGHAAVHASQLSPARIAAHYSTGAYGTVSGPQGDLPQVRLAAILCWGQLGFPRGGPLTLNGAAEPVLLGPAYDTGGSSATSALATIMTSEGGMAASMPSGVLTYLPRWWLYNLPSQVTFGDANDPAAGEIPFLAGQGWDLDTTYLYDQTAITRVSGPTTSVTATWRRTQAAQRYFTRSALTQQIETTSDYDAYDASTWYAAQYGQPVLRLRNIVVDAVTNPQAAFPAMLPLRPGAVVTANRRPIGGVPVSTVVQVQKISVRVGASQWRYTLQASPYQPQGSVLQADVPGFDTPGAVQALAR